ncbi:MAG: glycoside hydrolase family 2 TIM barrel-domain containing protein [Lacibacter sp.]
MKNWIILLCLACTVTETTAQITVPGNGFNSNWKFIKAKITGAESVTYNDDTWRTVNLPHDWSIEDLPNTNSPFDSLSACGKETGFTIGGTGWYRKHFRLSQLDSGKIISILFDGIYMNADVWINGHHLGNHPYGYTAFRYQLTNYLNFGNADNVIAVEVKNEGCNSRWYSGSGIYRHVTLEVKNKLHVAPWGIYIKTISADDENAKLEVKASVLNELAANSSFTFNCRIVNAAGVVVAQNKLHSYAVKNVAGELMVPLFVSKPQLWSPESPSLYKVETELLLDGNVTDRTETSIGIRTFRFDSEKGFFLNGKNLKLKGGTVHADNGPLGAAAFQRAEERRVELLKAAGFNAVRCSHNPPSSYFLDACDRLGLLVIDESFDVWTRGWVNDDYHVYFNDWWQKDLTSIVLRDRNHPSIFAWGIGNQIREGRDSIGVALAYQLANFVRSLDPTRVVTADVAITGRDWRNGSPAEWVKCDPLFGALDICGYSYQSSQFENDHQRLPGRIMYSIEIDPRHSFDNWMKVMDHEYIPGNFEWTAMDYIGESGSGWYHFSERPASYFPWHVSFSGDIDICGFRRPRSYYRNILFGNEKKLYLFVASPVSTFGKGGNSYWGWEDVKASWTWPGNENKLFAVTAYSSCDSVQLWLNNQLMGTKLTSQLTEFKASWQIPYIKGELKALGFMNGIIVEEQKLITAGGVSQIRLTADRLKLKANGEDLSYITVELTDKKGIVNPLSANEIYFSTKGVGKVVAVCNTDPLSLESFQQPKRKVFEGKCLVVVQSTGTAGAIILTAKGKGLKEQELKIISE